METKEQPQENKNPKKFLNKKNLTQKKKKKKKNPLQN